MLKALSALAILLAWAGAACAQISNDVVKFGVLTDMTGLTADGTGKGSLIAAQMAVEDFGGKAAGKVIEVISADHQNKPDVGSAIARRWYDMENVDVIVDVPISSVAVAVQQVTRDKDKVLLMSSAASSDLTGKACSPNGIQWSFDTYALANVAGRAMAELGNDKWFFLTVDYVFGHNLEKDAIDVVRKMGGSVVGSVRHPPNTPDFSSYILQAQASNANVIALASTAGDTENELKQAKEFGLADGGKKIIALLFGALETHTVGINIAQNLLLTEGFYWDLDEGTRAFSKRFQAKIGRMPTMQQAGVYSSVSHYLKAVEATGTDSAKTVIAKMKEMPVNDFFAKNGRIREDGRMIHDMYLMQVKTPAESKGEWDLLKLVATIPGEAAFRPLAQSECPYIKK
jgi:branched-chain amino acid transport system substrate-binding protein